MPNNPNPKRYERRMRRKIGMESKKVCDGDRCFAGGESNRKRGSSRGSEKGTTSKSKRSSGVRYERYFSSHRPTEFKQESKEKWQKITSTATGTVDFDAPKDEPIAESIKKKRTVKDVRDVVHTADKTEDIESPLNKSIYEKDNRGFKKATTKTLNQKGRKLQPSTFYKENRRYKRDKKGQEYLSYSRQEDSDKINIATFKKRGQHNLKKTVTIDKDKAAKVDKEMTDRQKKKYGASVDKRFRYYKRKGAAEIKRR